jgi:DNA-binding SARP family transcriptional activator
VRYEILGPLRVVDEEGGTFVRARKTEVLLTTLLVRADQIVPADALITEIWGGNVPRRATDALYVHVSQLRKLLRRSRRPGGPIVTQPPGYLLSLDRDEFDLHIFLEKLDRGRVHARNRCHQPASRCFESALAMWRGPGPGAVCNGPILDGFMTWLAETRLECIEMFLDSQLNLGRHLEMISRLYALTAEYPLREAFYRQLMMALYQSDRQADALNVYQTARNTLNGQLGLEPCRALQDLQRYILRPENHVGVSAAVGADGRVADAV